MANVSALVQDDVVSSLLEIIALVRRGEITGVTVVTTDYLGTVEARVISVPQPDAKSFAA
jgi:hypothetical protein